MSTPTTRCCADAQLLDLLQQAPRALGFTRRVTHTEVKLTPDGPRVIEVNARLGGDLIPYLGLRARHRPGPGRRGRRLRPAAGDRGGRTLIGAVRFLYVDRDDTTIAPRWSSRGDPSCRPRWTSRSPLRAAPGRREVSPPPTGRPDRPGGVRDRRSVTSDGASARGGAGRGREGAALVRDTGRRSRRRPSNELATDEGTGVLATLRGAPTPVRALLAGVLVNRLGRFLQVYLVLFLTERGFSAAQAGLALGGYGAGSVAGVLVGGVLADRLGARRSTLLSMLGSAGLLLAMAAVRNYAVLLTVVVLVGVTTQVFRPAAAALLAELTPRHRRVMIFAVYRLAFGIGNTAAPLLGAALLVVSYDLLFVVEAAACVAFAAVAAVALPRRSAGPAGPGDPGRSGGSGGYGAVLADRRYLLFLAALFCNMTAYMQAVAVLPLAMRSAGLATGWYSAALTLNGLLVITCQLPATRVVQRWPTRSVLIAGFLLLGGGHLLYGLPYGAAVFLVGTLVWSVGEIVGGPTMAAYPSLAAPEQLRGRYQGAAQAAYGLATALGPFLGVLLWDAIGPASWVVTRPGQRARRDSPHCSACGTPAPPRPKPVPTPNPNSNRRAAMSRPAIVVDPLSTGTGVPGRVPRRRAGPDGRRAQPGPAERGAASQLAPGELRRRARRRPRPAGAGGAAAAARPAVPGRRVGGRRGAVRRAGPHPAARHRQRARAGLGPPRQVGDGRRAGRGRRGSAAPALLGRPCGHRPVARRGRAHRPADRHQAAQERLHRQRAPGAAGQTAALFDMVLGRRNLTGGRNEAVLVQEYAEGTEFLVDSYSVDGRHGLVDVCRYAKSRRADRIGIYDRVQFLPPDSAAVAVVWDYARRVLDAVGIRNGCAHTEVMLTAAGPRLVETAARPAGGGHQGIKLAATGDNQIHRTVAHRVHGEFRDGFDLVQHLRGIFISAYRDGYFRNREVFDGIEALKSFHWMKILHDEDAIVPETVDLFTCLAWVILIHSDPATLDADYHRVLEMEAGIVIETR